MGPLSVLQCRHVSLLTAVFLALVSTATWCPASATVHVLRPSSRFVWDIAASTSLRAEAFHHDDIDAHGDPVSSWGGASRQLLQDSTLCYRNQVQCPSGIAECYDYYKSCNGENDCSDGSDESSGFCAPFDCSAYAFRGKCPSGLCTTTSVNAPLYTPREFLCDGIKDCPDNSDEDPSFCANYDCASVGALTCPGPAKQCIRRSSSNNSIIYYTNPYGPSSTPDGFPTSICDGVKDCNDGSDEDPGLCSAFSCENGSFKCGDRCIGRYKLCDGVIDCPDGGSDEDPTLCGPTYNCSQAGLFGGYQRCPSGVGCYYGPQNNCNGRYECSDQSDEDPALCGADSQCYDRQVKCPGGVGCVYFEGICNGIFDCLDKSDESAEFCANRTCDSYHVKCPSGQGGCLAPSQICDGKVDCLDGSDESDATCSAYDCSGGGFRTRCPSGIGCADNFTLCDGIPGNGVSLCKDGSDEDPAFCAGFQCRFGGQIKCRDGTCHTGGNLCDGHTDCSDGSDEDPSYCQVAECASDESKCSDGIHCVSTALFCDGRFDCPDRSDESLEVCATRPCPFEGRVKCPGGNGQCIGATNLCDGVTDCQDGSDETSSLCETYDCGADRFKCPGTDVCVYGKPCNGVPNCPDRSDESEALCQSGTLSPSPTPSPIPIPPPGQTDAPAPIFPPPSDTPAPTTSSPSDTPAPTTPSPSDTPAPTTPPPSDTLAPTTPSPSDTPAPTTPLPSNTPAPTTGAPSPTTGAATCDPNSGTPNQCFNAQGSASVCCPGQCPSNPGDTPACAGLGTGTCDPSSSTPNQCFNANGDQSVCCPGSCPGSPGPVAACG